MKRHSVLAACLLMCAAARAADVPAPCRATSAPDRILNTRFTIDFTHPLPIPDYVDTVVACTSFPRPPSPPPPPKSAWIESERALYADVLARHPVDVLVVPFQTQGYGLDRIERALLTSELAYAIGDASDLKIADPFLVARAFGEGARRIAPSDVVNLARKLDTMRVITGYIGHDRHHAFTLTLQVQDLSAPQGKQVVWQRDWRSVAFTDQRTPAVVFNDMLPDVLRTLPLKLKAPQALAAAAPNVAPSVISQAPRELALAFNGLGPMATAAAFDLLGALAPPHSELARERAFERALVVSASAARSDPSAQFLKAYALMQVWRRPGALAALEGQTSPESLALVDLLNGDLPSAQKSVARVPQSLPRLLLDAALRDLEAAYERKLQASPMASKQTFGPASASWAPFVDLRSRSSEHWSVADPLVIKALLDRTFPVPELAARKVLVGGTVGEIEVDLANERHVRRVATQTEPGACCKTAALRPAPWDLLWLFEGLADESVRKNLLRQLEFQGVPTEAMADISRYEPLLIGQPVLEAARSEAAGQIAGKSTDDTNANWRAQADQAAAVAGHFSPGQNLITLVAGADEAYDYDYPRRPFWKSFPGGRLDGEFQQNHVTAGLEGLAFSTSDLTPLAGLQYGNAPPDQLAAVIASLGARFTGNPGKPLGNAPVGGSQDKLAQLEAALKADPVSWQRYDALGSYLVSSGGSYTAVRDTFLKFPGFKDPHPDNPVELSNYAAHVGGLLLGQGQPQLAQPFFGIAARLDTGSYASLESAAVLQVMRGDYAAAAAAYLELTRTYDASQGYEEYLSLLHALDRSRQAWARFSQVQASSIDPEVWVSALVAHNREGLDQAKVRAWLLRPENRDAHFRGVRFAPYYAVVWSSTDHMPPADLGKLVEQLDGGLTSRAYLSSTLVPSIMAADGFDGALQSRFRTGKGQGPLEQTPIRSQLAYFADAYTLVRLGDYESAVARFLEMADHYRIEDYPLAYFAYAAAKTGDREHLEKYIETRDTPYPAFDSWLAIAFFAASRHDTETALKDLHSAFRTRPGTGNRPILTGYEYAQACEWLFKDTGDAHFKDELLTWVRRYQVIAPAQSWAYTMQYTYEKPGVERTRALAIARYLDPTSQRIQKASKADLGAAQDWFRQHNPFRIPERNPNSPEKIARNDRS